MTKWRSDDAFNLEMRYPGYEADIWVLVKYLHPVLHKNG